MSYYIRLPKSQMQRRNYLRGALKYVAAHIKMHLTDLPKQQLTPNVFAEMLRTERDLLDEIEQLESVGRCKSEDVLWCDACGSWAIKDLTEYTAGMKCHQLRLLLQKDGCQGTLVIKQSRIFVSDNVRRFL